MESRKEKVFTLISELKFRFYDTPDKFFIALVETLIEQNYSDEDIGRIVKNTILNVPKTRLTVADVINNAVKSPYEFMLNGKRCYGDRSDPAFIPDNANPRPNNRATYSMVNKEWVEY